MAFTTAPVVVSHAQPRVASSAAQYEPAAPAGSGRKGRAARQANVNVKACSFVGSKSIGSFNAGSDAVKALQGSSRAAHRAATLSIEAKKGDMLKWLEQLEYKLEKVPNSRYEATVTVPAGAMVEFFEGAKQEFTKDLNIPGFRRGKAPSKAPQIASVSKSIAMQSAISWASQAVLFKAKVEAIGEPDLISDGEELLAKVEKDAPLTFKIGFDVWPEVKLGSYTGMKVKAEKVESDVDKEVDEYIARHLRRLASSEPLKRSRAARAGDVVEVTFQGYKVESGGHKGEPMEALTLEKQEVDLGNQLLHPGFVSSVAGMKKGEQKEFRVDFEDDYANSLLRGKSVIFDLTLHEVKEAKIPELEDYMADEIAKGQTAATLRDHLRATLAANTEAATKQNVENALIRAVRNIVEAEMPEKLVNQELQRTFQEEVEKKATREHLKPDQINALVTKEVFDRFAAKYRERAVHELEWLFASEEIAKAEGLQPTKEEVEDKLRVVKGMYKHDPNFSEAEMRPKCEIAIRLEKVLEYLTANNKVEYVPEGSLAGDADSEDWSDFIEDDSWMYEEGVIRDDKGAVLKEKPAEAAAAKEKKPAAKAKGAGKAKSSK